MDTTTQEISTMLSNDVLIVLISNFVLHIDLILEQTSMPITASQSILINQSNP